MSRPEWTLGSPAEGCLKGRVCGRTHPATLAFGRVVGAVSGEVRDPEPGHPVRRTMTFPHRFGVPVRLETEDLHDSPGWRSSTSPLRPGPRQRREPVGRGRGEGDGNTPLPWGGWTKEQKTRHLVRYPREELGQVRDLEELRGRRDPSFADTLQSHRYGRPPSRRRRCPCRVGRAPSTSRLGTLTRPPPRPSSSQESFRERNVLVDCEIILCFGHTCFPVGSVHVPESGH